MTYKQSGIIGSIILAIIFAAGVFAHAGEFPRASTQPTQYASTTAYSLAAGTSVQIIATSTFRDATGLVPATTVRNALTLQAINCNAGGQVWLQFNDVAAAVNTGYNLGASTTLNLASNIPNVYGAIRAVATGGNCTLLETEYRTQP